MSDESAACVERLLSSFTLYDRNVDVVSAHEFIYTGSNTELPATVAHFERFPQVPGTGGTMLTPDFTVLFEDGSGIASEIARFALHENSVDQLCEQIGRYDKLKTLPSGGDAAMAAVSEIDVMLLVPQELGPQAVKRIIEQRMKVSEHPYTPDRPPCIVQFGFDQGKYMFQRIMHPENGILNDGDRVDGLGNWFDEQGQFVVKPEKFRGVKASRAFVNDPVDALYLATHLWVKTFPSRFGGVSARGEKRQSLTAGALAESLRLDFGVVRAADVDKALELLRQAGLAERVGGEWVIIWKCIKSRVNGSSDIAAELARRACSESKPRARPAQKKKAPSSSPASEDESDMTLF